MLAWPSSPHPTTCGHASPGQHPTASDTPGPLSREQRACDDAGHELALHVEAVTRLDGRAERVQRRRVPRARHHRSRLRDAQRDKAADIGKGLQTALLVRA